MVQSYQLNSIVYFAAQGVGHKLKLKVFTKASFGISFPAACCSVGGGLGATRWRDKTSVWIRRTEGELDLSLQIYGGVVGTG
jgi:hypothetical protein